MGKMRVPLVSLFAVLLGGASPQEPAPKPERGASEKVVAALDNVASALKQTPGPRRSDRVCQKQEENRSSELCAEWSAADAAHNSAVAAWVAVFFSFLGTALIAFTFWETRRTSRRQLRAYVLLDSANIHKCSEEGAPDFKGCVHPEARYVVIMIKNFGTTPAHNMRFRVGTAIKPFPNREPPPPFPEDLQTAESDLAQRRPRSMVLEVFNSGPMHDSLRQGGWGIFVWALVEYEDIFGRPHKTRIQLVSEGEGYTVNRLHAVGDNSSD